MATNKWPYSDFHELNLDWILGKVKNIDSDAAAASAAAEEAAESASAAHLDAQSASGAADRAEAAAASIASGSPVVVTLAADMTDTDLIYLYMGSETGYNYGEWYYYDGQDWVSGGIYGAGVISSNARNLLNYILQRVAYTEQGMQQYVTALIEALKVNGGTSTQYAVVYLLSNVTTDGVSDVDPGDAFTCTLTEGSNYLMESVTVTMGGVDITSAAYSNGVVTIDRVTGDVTITAEALACSVAWDYTKGLPDANGFTKIDQGSPTIEIVTGGLHVFVPAGSGNKVQYQWADIGTTKTKTVEELKFKINTYSTLASAGLRFYNGRGTAAGGTAANGMEMMFADNGSQTGIVWLAQASGWSVISSTPVTTGEEHTCRLVQTAGSCEVWLDGVLLDTVTSFREPVGYPSVTANQAMDVTLISYKIRTEA